MSIVIPSNTPVDDTLPIKSKKHNFFPVARVVNGKIQLNDISVCQGEKDNYTEIGAIKIPEFYTHGRDIEDIDIQIKLQATSTTVEAVIFIAQGKQNKDDISIVHSIQLESKNSLAPSP